MGFSRESVLGAGIVATLGVTTTAAHVTHTFSENEDLTTFLFGILIPLLFSLALVYLGAWIFRSGFDPRGVVRVSVWTMAGVVAFVGINVLTVLYQQAEGGGCDE